MIGDRPRIGVERTLERLKHTSAKRPLLAEPGSSMLVDRRLRWQPAAELPLSTLNGPSSLSEVNGGFQLTATVRLGTPNDESSGSLAVIHKEGWP